jgi:hypothetical protein
LPSAGFPVCEYEGWLIAKSTNLKTRMAKSVYHKFGRSFVMWEETNGQEEHKTKDYIQTIIFIVQKALCFRLI